MSRATTMFGKWKVDNKDAWRMVVVPFEGLPEGMMNPLLFTTKEAKGNEGALVGMNFVFFPNQLGIGGIVRKIKVRFIIL